MVNVFVLRAPGTNCDGETCYAFERVGARTNGVHVNALLASPQLLDSYQILVFPGGFSYGDDVAAGKILANQLRLSLGEQLRKFRDRGNLILGICNGFQVLVKAGLLPGWDGPEADGQVATLTTNDSGRFEDRWISLAVHPGRSPFLQGTTRLDLPIAHGEGKFVCRDAGALHRIRAGGHVVLTYTGQDPGRAGQGACAGSALLPYPINPNGSQDNIAGICDTTGRVLGLMPHPERHMDPTQHPQWTRRPSATEGDGLMLFRNAVAYFG